MRPPLRDLAWHVWQALGRLPTAVRDRAIAAEMKAGLSVSEAASAVAEKVREHGHLAVITAHPDPRTQVLGDWLEEQGLDRERLGQSVMDYLHRRFGVTPADGRWGNVVWKHCEHRFHTSGKNRERLFYKRPGLGKQVGGPRGKEITRLDQLETILAAIEADMKNGTS